MPRHQFVPRRKTNKMKEMSAEPLRAQRLVCDASRMPCRTRRPARRTESAKKQNVWGCVAWRWFLVQRVLYTVNFSVPRSRTPYCTVDMHMADSTRSRTTTTLLCRTVRTLTVLSTRYDTAWPRVQQLRLWSYSTLYYSKYGTVLQYELDMYYVKSLITQIITGRRGKGVRVATHAA